MRRNVIHGSIGEIDRRFRALDAAPEAERRARFRAYCEAVVPAVRGGELSPTKAGQLLLAALAYRSLQEAPDSRRILELAGLLQLPEYHLYGDPQALWHELLLQLKQLQDRP